MRIYIENNKLILMDQKKDEMIKNNSESGVYQEGEATNLP